MILETLPGVSELSDTDKWQLIDELWTGLLPPPATAPSPETVAMLEARLAEYHRDPAAAAPWAEVKKRLQAARGL